MAPTPKVYQFKITLKGSKPKIWRRIQVPEKYNFFELHVAIQDAMGWTGGHLHQFEMRNPETGKKELIGKPMPEWDFEVIPEKRVKISKYFCESSPKARYEYDFGDGWDHDVFLEHILPAQENTEYPRCMAGKRACPPENIGGIGGYEELLEIMADPDHPEYKEKMEQLAFTGDEDFDPEKFDPSQVNFDDPAEYERFSDMFGF